jgi:alpha-tubulin suppressor-like RCC1 family protein
MVRSAPPYGTPNVVRAMNVTATSVAAGDVFTCGLYSGFVQCWGNNGAGELGNGTIPSAAPYHSLVPVSAVFAGTAATLGAHLGRHSCVQVQTGALRCWGYNASGQLGDGTVTDAMPYGKPSGVTVTGLPGSPVGFGLGQDATCAVMGTGSIWCWGNNGAGQLGTGLLTPTHTGTPVETIAITAAKPVAVSLGSSYACALLENGAIWCWGYNLFGQLGNDTFIDSSSPVAVLPW